MRTRRRIPLLLAALLGTAFTRSIDLPFAVNCDDVDATYRDGVLNLHLKRCEADKPRQIAVQS